MSLLSFRWKVAISTTLLLSTVWVFLIAKEAVPHPATYLRLLTNGGLLNSGTLFSPELAVDWTLAPGSDLVVKEEGVNVSTATGSLDFVGTGSLVTVPNVGSPNDLLVTFTGGSGSGGTNDTPTNSGATNGETTVNDATNDFSIGGSGSGVAKFFFDANTGSLQLNEPGAGIVVAPHPTDGASLVLSEGAGDGTEVFTLKVDNAGLTSNVTCTLDALGQLDAACPLINNLSSGATNINALTDVDTTTVSPTMGDLLSYDGANWVPALPEGALSYYRFEVSGAAVVPTGQHLTATLVTSREDAIQAASPVTLQSGCSSSGDCIRVPLVNDGAGNPTVTRYRIDLTLEDLGTSGNHCGLLLYANNVRPFTVGTAVSWLRKIVGNPATTTTLGNFNASETTTNPGLDINANFGGASVFTEYSTATLNSTGHTIYGLWRDPQTVSQSADQGCDWASGDGKAVIEIWRMSP